MLHSRSSYRLLWMEACHFWRCVIRQHQQCESSTETDDPSLYAINTSVESIIDDILLGLSNSQIMIANSTKPPPANAQISAVRLGQISIPKCARSLTVLFLIARGGGGGLLRLSHPVLRIRLSTWHVCVGSTFNPWTILFLFRIQPDIP